MEVKLFEVRDRGTFIPTVAIKLEYGFDDRTALSERHLLRRCGYAEVQINPLLNTPHEPYVLFGYLRGDGSSLHYDPHAWPNRTMATAHRHVIERWNDLESGEVIDVEHILGETPEPKLSERPHHG